jgi:hypothetical protein
LALELIGTGDQAGTWGNTTNTNLGTLIEQAISGYVTQAVATGTDTTITIPNGATGVARNMFIELTGTGGASTNLIVPANKKLYFIYNNASGAVTVKVAGQTGVSVAVGAKVILVSNGTDVVEATTYLTAVPSSLSVTTLSASSANITTLSGTTATYTNGSFTSANITTVSGTTASYTNGSFTSANITTLSGTSATYTNGSFTSANITTVTGTSATFTTSSDGVGNLRNIPSAGSAKTSSYTLTTSDIGEFVTVGTGGSITVPNDVFAAGNAVSIYNDTTGNVTITCSITTAYIAGTNTDKATMTLATRGLATFLFVNPSLCVASGNLT